ncbi:MAG: hypothetical protein LC777_08615 [Actinobacteria bacterium]|nr:hypothetical protein [Actinomycetota bacterium]
MGWGPIPGRDDPGRRRWLRAHAKNVRRWLDDLQAAGIISYTGEHDNLGMDWRTLIRGREKFRAENRVSGRSVRGWEARRTACGLASGWDEIHRLQLGLRPSLAQPRGPQRRVVVLGRGRGRRAPRRPGRVLSAAADARHGLVERPPPCRVPRGAHA